MFDLNNPQHAHVDQRMRNEPIIWFGSVRTDGRPHMVPVWFLWDGATILIFSQPKDQKIRNLQNNSHVTLALEAANDGGDIAIIEGVAELIDDDVNVTLPDYVAKYGARIQQMGWKVADMAATYSQGIRVTPTRLIAWS